MFLLNFYESVKKMMYGDTWTLLNRIKYTLSQKIVYELHMPKWT